MTQKTQKLSPLKQNATQILAYFSDQTIPTTPPWDRLPALLQDLATLLSSEADQASLAATLTTIDLIMSEAGKSAQSELWELLAPIDVSGLRTLKK